MAPRRPASVELRPQPGSAPEVAFSSSNGEVGYIPITNGAHYAFSNLVVGRDPRAPGLLLAAAGGQWPLSTTRRTAAQVATLLLRGWRSVPRGVSVHGAQGGELVVLWCTCGSSTYNAAAPPWTSPLRYPHLSDGPLSLCMRTGASTAGGGAGSACPAVATSSIAAIATNKSTVSCSFMLPSLLSSVAAHFLLTSNA